MDKQTRLFEEVEREEKDYREIICLSCKANKDIIWRDFDRRLGFIGFCESCMRKNIPEEINNIKKCKLCKDSFLIGKNGINKKHLDWTPKICLNCFRRGYR